MGNSSVTVVRLAPQPRLCVLCVCLSSRPEHPVRCRTQDSVSSAAAWLIGHPGPPGSRKNNPRRGSAGLVFCTRWGACPVAVGVPVRGCACDVCLVLPLQSKHCVGSRRHLQRGRHRDGHGGASAVGVAARPRGACRLRSRCLLLPHPSTFRRCRSWRHPWTSRAAGVRNRQRASSRRGG